MSKEEGRKEEKAKTGKKKGRWNEEMPSVKPFQGYALFYIFLN